MLQAVKLSHVEREFRLPHKQRRIRFDLATAWNFMFKERWLMWMRIHHVLFFKEFRLNENLEISQEPDFKVAEISFWSGDLHLNINRESDDRLASNQINRQSSSIACTRQTGFFKTKMRFLFFRSTESRKFTLPKWKVDQIKQFKLLLFPFSINFQSLPFYR